MEIREQLEREHQTRDNISEKEMTNVEELKKWLVIKQKRTWKLENRLRENNKQGTILSEKEINNVKELKERLVMKLKIKKYKETIKTETLNYIAAEERTNEEL